MTVLEKAREFFAADLFATKLAGITIDEADENHAVCSFKVTDDHKNADGVVMGGALYTLADLCFAVAANVCGVRTVTLDASVRYLAPATGEKVTATARCIRSGKSVCTYEVMVNDGIRDVVHAVFTGFRKG